ncbi:MAG: type I restriction endonuclease subunit R [Candidatus Microsaccharimonas sp.]
MTTQSEQSLENELLTQLQGLKYERIIISDEASLVANLRTQIEKHNNITLTDKEFTKILNHLSKGNVYERAKILRDKFHLIRDDGKTPLYIEFFNSRDWCHNEFQVTNQVTVEGSYKNRYDVTILINGLPLVQIELKRNGLGLKEAFNQTNRYQRHSYDASYGLFQYIQMFVISNGSNTKYYANNRKQDFKFTSFWTDVDNNKITELHEFTDVFLDRCHVAKMIAKYTVLTEARTLMLLRPYQYYAVEKIVDRVKNSTKGGYIWHTTGSGKTLTSFKASQILVDLPEIYKVVFVVDRNDLDTQTIREFNEFRKDSVDSTDSTRNLVKQFGDPDTKLIVTTIQKLNNAITNDRHALKMDKLRDEKVVFIFDECHRSQFGETHKKITEYFTNHQLFGFTGTPIFAENASGNGLGKRTTADLFGEKLHSYVITDAIGDENVLKFAVEYVGKYKYKDGSANNVDIDVEAIDKKELMESPQRLEKIVDYILDYHAAKTYNCDYSAIFAVSNVDTLTKYYEIFKAKQAGLDRPLRIATIFSYAANEDDKDANGMLDADIDITTSGPINQHSRDKLESYIADYNAQFGTNYTTKDSKSFYSYYRDIGQKLKNREKTDLPEDRIDILLVVNMFLTGFDAKKVNTLYVDKNLRYHGLLQAYSRTNRIINETKSQGNIVVFRNLKEATDDALALFADKNANETIFIEPYEHHIVAFNAALAHLLQLTPSPADVDRLVGEQAELDFVTAFRELLRLKNTLITFADFTFDHTGISEQVFESFKSKYLDIYAKVRHEHEPEKVSILNDVDFELELIRRDDVNVDYILRLLTQLVGASGEDKTRLIRNIFSTMSGDPVLRSKRDLIEKFINGTIPKISDREEVESAFENFWSVERADALKRISDEEGAVSEKLEKLVEDYIFTNRKPRRSDLVNALVKKPGILQINGILKRLNAKFSDYLETFVDGA